MATKTLDDTNHAPPGAPPVANYAYVTAAGNYKPVAGVDNGDGTASLQTSVGGAATEATLLNVKRAVTDFRTLLDYDVRVDGNPVYVGKNAQSALIGDTTWSIQKLFYDTTNRLIDAQVLVGAWASRASLAWRSPGGN